jgi:putative PIN family toxin of toxin-antitoxin system
VDEERRTVPDTNTLVSAILFRRSVPARALRRARRVGKTLASEETLQELLEVLSRDQFDRYILPAIRDSFYKKFRRQARIVEVDLQVQACRDPRDDKFLSLALAGRAQTLITGDRHLLELHPFRGVAIMTPEDYLKLP